MMIYVLQLNCNGMGHGGDDVSMWLEGHADVSLVALCETKLRWGQEIVWDGWSFVG